MDWMNIARYFYLTDERLQQISRDFAADMERALCGQTGATVSALKSHVSLPGGDEHGVYLALDFGGTNVRAARIRLLGRHCYLIEKKVCQPLRLPGQYDYLSSATTAGELFGFLARLVGQVAHGQQAYTLGHTFSFAMERQDLRDGRLLSWSKEIAVPGVEGEWVNALLKQALARQGLRAVEPVALVNDTTALLLSAAYTLERVRLGLVCGTGFNACYYEPAWDMIVNLEAGDYGGLIRNRWDKAAGAVSCGILRHLYGGEAIPAQSVAVDGSLLEHVRGALFMMEDAMQACQNEGVSRDKQIPVDPVLIQDGPLVGAAVAAAIAGEGR